MILSKLSIEAGNDGLETHFVAYFGRGILARVLDCNFTSRCHALFQESIILIISKLHNRKAVI